MDGAARRPERAVCAVVLERRRRNLHAACARRLQSATRAPVRHADTGPELFPGRPLPHFNEVDEGAGVDALVTNLVWTELGFDPATTLHDLRWGEPYRGEGLDAFVWVFEISGAVPASHFPNGYAGATGDRQPPMYFPLGGSTLSGVSKPGEIVWSRVFVMGGGLHVDLGRGRAAELPAAETERRRWPRTARSTRGPSIRDGYRRLANASRNGALTGYPHRPRSAPAPTHPEAQRPTTRRRDPKAPTRAAPPSRRRWEGARPAPSSRAPSA